jgi:hypothetical protein
MNTLISTAKALLKILVASVISVFVFLFAMGFADGPWGMVPGGAFSETSQAAPADWSFAKELNTVEFQLAEPVSSRTSWIMEHNSRIFIPSGYMNSTIGKIWKHWPMRAEQNGNALLRIDGNVYEVHLQRTKDAELLTPIMSELARKYMGIVPPIDDEVLTGMHQQVSSNNLWVFELVGRS